MRRRVQTSAIGGLVATVGSSDAAARQRIRSAKLQLRDLDEQAEKLKADLAKVATARKARTELRASVHASAAGSATFSVEYQVTNVGWNWQYEARLDSQKKTVALVRQAQLQQGTGEDWNNIELTISTSQPSLNATTPALASLFLNLRVAALPRRQRRDLEEVVVTGYRASRIDAIAARRTLASASRSHAAGRRQEHRRSVRHGFHRRLSHCRPRERGRRPPAAALPDHR